MSQRPGAAIYFEPEGYTTTGPRLMGRHVAGEGFLQGYARHAGVAPLTCAVRHRSAAAAFAQACAVAPGDAARVRALGLDDHAGLSQLGTLFVPGPNLGPLAWRRQRRGATGYSLCGVTHTISSAGAMDSLADLLYAPVAHWDALVCTSRAVLDSVRRLLDSTADYLKQRLGAQRVVGPMLALIPLGVDCAALASDPAVRAEWRSRLGAADDDVVFLFMGRLSFHAKANPWPMYRALELAAGRVPRRLHLVQAGWFANEAIEGQFREGAKALCPSVQVTFLDGRRPDVRSGIWHAADVFTSLSDNIQETFGLTPAEAMAAGLPSVISDWNGYRDTVRDGIDGYLIPTLMPAPPAGATLAARHAAGIDDYDKYVGRVSLSVAVDVAACAEAYVRLAGDTSLRQTMGRAARARAEQELDWSVVVGRYQTLWASLAERRAAAGAALPARADPRRPDPFWLFGRYPSRTLTPADRVALAPGATAADARRLRTVPLAAFSAKTLASPGLTDAVLHTVAARGACAVSDLLALGRPEDGAALARTIAWLCKLDVLRLEGQPGGVIAGGPDDRSSRQEPRRSV